MLSTLAALMVFRRPDVEVMAGGAGESGHATVRVLSPSMREPVPLSLHHLPLAVTFVFFEVSEMVCSGSLILNAQHLSES
jgi:exosome complex RNA-binding protein Rrp42 (RNase PH superfamily)